MTRVYCFSGSGHSLAVAQFFAERLGCETVPIRGEEAHACRLAVIVFPVYCQNVPAPVLSFLRGLSCRYAVIVATYGRISYGNALCDAKKKLSGQVIAGAYVPTGHTFLKGDHAFDSRALLPILEKIKSPSPAVIPKCRKNPLADFFPAWRSRIGVKLRRTEQCNGCGVCEALCPMGAIRNGKIRASCIRCLRCVTECPRQALRFENTWILQTYLDAYHKNELVLYL